MLIPFLFIFYIIILLMLMLLLLRHLGCLSHLLTPKQLQNKKQPSYLTEALQFTTTSYRFDDEILPNPNKLIFIRSLLCNSTLILPIRPLNSSHFAGFYQSRSRLIRELEEGYNYYEARC